MFTPIRIAALAGVIAIILPVPLRSQEKPEAVKPKASTHPAVKEPKENERGHVHYLDFRNGFRGVKFGTPMSQFQGLELVRDTGAVKIYRKANDDLKIGEVQLDKVRYHFTEDGKFMGVSLFTKEESDGDALLQIFELAYGMGVPAKPHPGGENSSHASHAHEFLWKGKVANARLTFGEEHDAEAWIGNNDLQDQSGKLQKKLAEEAAATL